MAGDEARTSVYHCDKCGGETNVDAHGSCPDGEPHAVDLLWHHRHAHVASDADGNDPDCEYCRQHLTAPPGQDRT